MKVIIYLTDKAYRSGIVINQTEISFTFSYRYSDQHKTYGVINTPNAF